MVRFIVDSAIAEIINDFNETCNYFGYYPKIVDLLNNPQSDTPFQATFNIRGIPSHQLLRSLSLRFNKVIVIIKDETNVFVEFFDDTLPF